MKIKVKDKLIEYLYCHLEPHLNSYQNRVFDRVEAAQPDSQCVGESSIITLLSHVTSKAELRCDCDYSLSESENGGTNHNS